MFTSLWNFLKRHKRKFIFTGAFLGGVVLLGRYAKEKLKQLQDLEANECLAHARRQHHFDSNQRTCNMTVLSMIPTLREVIMQLLDTEALTAELKSKPENKLRVWDQLKVLSVTRSIVAVYSSCLLVVFLRLQLNIIGGYMYLDNLRSQEGQAAAKATSEVQQKYLATVQYILQQGISKLVTAAEAAVQEKLGSVSLKQPMTLVDVQDVVSHVRRSVEYVGPGDNAEKTQSGLTQYLVPEDEMDEEETLTELDKTLTTLKKETKEMVESDDFHLVLTVCLDGGFARFYDRLAEYFKSSNAGNSGTSSVTTMPLAKVIPIINGMINVILTDAPNQFIQDLLLKEQVKDFAANVYEAFSQPVDQLTRN